MSPVTTELVPNGVKFLNELTQFAEKHGLELLGTAPIRKDEIGWLRPHSERLHTWVNEKRHGEMEYMEARLEARCAPHLLLPNARTALVFWASHHFPTPPVPTHLTARVARYAWGRDYHNVLRKSVSKVHRWIGEQFEAYQSYTSIDTGAILERAFAERAGIGWIGRSTMLINQDKGTFGSLAVIFTNLNLPTEETAHPFRCGTCQDCVIKCPTQALSPDGLDARLCISYWTIEHRGMIPLEMRTKIDDWLFGCDICQDVCPWNRKAENADDARWQPKDEHATPNLRQWLALSHEALDEHLRGSPLRRAKPTGLKRNICIVAANLQLASLLPDIEIAMLNDPSDIVRATALWAATKLGSKTALDATAYDPSPTVIAERRSLLGSQPLPAQEKSVNQDVNGG